MQAPLVISVSSKENPRCSVQREQDESNSSEYEESSEEEEGEKTE